MTDNTSKGIAPPTLDFNDRMSSSQMMNSSMTHSMYDNDAVSGFASTVKASKLKKGLPCPIENNPLKELMEEEGRNLSPSQIAKEMLFNCRVMRRKDFTVSPLKAGEKTKDPGSPSNKSKISGAARMKSNLMFNQTKSALGHSGRADSPILEFSPR